MKRNLRRPLAISSWIFATIVALSLGLQPQSTSAARSIVVLADSNQAWSVGRFFRTGLATSEAPVFGGVQLIPAKVQSQYVPSGNLPIPLNAHSSVVYRNYIFVVGGNTKGDTSDLLYKSSAVFATRIADPATGALQDWTTLAPLPLALSDTSTVVIEVGGQPFLVVLGGLQGRDEPDPEGLPDTVSTSRIFYYPLNFNAQGNLNLQPQWQEVPQDQRLPMDTNYELGTPSAGFIGGGASGMGAASVSVNNDPYIYIFGGLNRTASAGAYNDRYSSRVYRARVTAGSTPGTLVLAWQNDPNTTNWNIRGLISNTEQDVYLAGPATVKFADPITGNTGVYLIGGKRCLSNCEGNELAPAFEADLNAYVTRIDSTGVPQWVQTGNMTPEGRYGHAALESEGQIVVSGGRNTVSDEATASMAEGYINQDLTLYREGVNANFNLSQGAMGTGRKFHTMETLDGGFYGDWAYLIGGSVKSGSSDQTVSTDVLRGNLDEPPLDTDTFVADGTYYSKVYDFGLNAKMYSMRWSATNENGTPIEMLYRYGDTPNTLTQFASIVPTLTTTASDGKTNYEATFPARIDAQYFQFAVRLRRSTASASPLLKSVSLDVERNGFPNIRVGDSGARFSPSPINGTSKVEPIIPVTNQPFQLASGGVIPALPANWDAEGSFFVGLYILPPNTNKPREDWPKFGDVGAAYAEVGKSSLPIMSPGQQFLIPKSAWRKWSDNTAAGESFWRSQFNQVGTYTVYMMVDTLPCDPATTTDAECRALELGLVKEAEVLTANGETDNVSFFTVQVAQSAHKMYIPMVPITTMTAASTATSEVAEQIMWPQTIK